MKTKSRRVSMTKQGRPVVSREKKVGSGPLKLRGPYALASRNEIQSTPLNET